jgi:hypothetical protein
MTAPINPQRTDREFELWLERYNPTASTELLIVAPNATGYGQTRTQLDRTLLLVVHDSTNGNKNNPVPSQTAYAARIASMDQSRVLLYPSGRPNAKQTVSRDILQLKSDKRRLVVLFEWMLVYKRHGISAEGPLPTGS